MMVNLEFQNRKLKENFELQVRVQECIAQKLAEQNQNRSTSAINPSIQVHNAIESERPSDRMSKPKAVKAVQPKDKKQTPLEKPKPVPPEKPVKRNSSSTSKVSSTHVKKRVQKASDKEKEVSVVSKKVSSIDKKA